MISRLQWKWPASALRESALQAVDGIVGVEPTIAEELERGSMVGVRSRFGDDVDHGSAGAAEFSRIAVGVYLKLLHSVFAELIRSATRAGAPQSLSEERVVVVSAVHGKRVQRATLSGKAEVAAAHVADDSGGQQREIKKVAAVGGQVGDLTITHRVAHAAARRLNHGRFRRDLDGFALSRNSQRHRQVDLGADGDLHFGIQCAETCMAGLNLVLPDGQEREHEQTLRIAGDSEHFASGGIGRDHFGVGERRAGWVDDSARDRASAGLRERADR